MNIHEYQAKKLFQHYAIPTPQGCVASSALDAQNIAQTLTNESWVVKAQIHAGGRGKVGGVKLANRKSAASATRPSVSQTALSSCAEILMNMNELPQIAARVISNKKW